MSALAAEKINGEYCELELIEKNIIVELTEKEAKPAFDFAKRIVKSKMKIEENRRDIEGIHDRFLNNKLGVLAVSKYLGLSNDKIKFKIGRGKQFLRLADFTVFKVCDCKVLTTRSDFHIIRRDYSGCHFNYFIFVKKLEGLRFEILGVANKNTVEDTENHRDEKKYSFGLRFVKSDKTSFSGYDKLQDFEEWREFFEEQEKKVWGDQDL